MLLVVMGAEAVLVARVVVDTMVQVVVNGKPSCLSVHHLLLAITSELGVS
jgi:hypothetical protein